MPPFKGSSTQVSKSVKPVSSMRLIAEGMLRENTPVEHYPEYNLWVKREDLACPPPGPPFSKSRGVYAWVKKQDSDLIGVLDTRHSQAGHAVARACQILGKKCLNFYPDYKGDPGPRSPQRRAASLGARLIPLPAGRSCILYHAAHKQTKSLGGVMIPNALKLDESVSETARECSVGRARLQGFDTVVIPVSSGTIAAGVMQGMGSRVNYVIHLGYSVVRSSSSTPQASQTTSIVSGPRIIVASYLRTIDTPDTGR